jgi:hypothetical protein
MATSSNSHIQSLISQTHPAKAQNAVTKAMRRLSPEAHVGSASAAIGAGGRQDVLDGLKLFWQAQTEQWILDEYKLSPFNVSGADNFIEIL